MTETIARVAKALFDFEGDGRNFSDLRVEQIDYWSRAATTALAAIDPITTVYIVYGYSHDETNVQSIHVTEVGATAAAKLLQASASKFEEYYVEAIEVQP